jgi:gas vesicle protein
MAEHDEVSYIVVERSGGSVLPFLWGALIGAAAMMLFAPRSGEETRRELGENLRKFRKRADEALRDARSTLSDTFDDVRSELDSRVSAAREAFDTGRRVGGAAARETRSDIERRVRETGAAMRSDYERRRTDGGGSGAESSGSPADPASGEQPAG